MPTPSLIDVLVRTAASAGCEEPTRLRHALEVASDNRQPLMDAVVDSTMVDEDRFFAQLATGLGMPYAEEGAGEAAEGLRNNFPAKLALRHRICPLHVASGEATILTYNPFDLSARQAVGQELRKRVHWQIAPRHRILEALHQGYGVGAENFEELLEGREAGDEHDDMKQETTVLDEADEEATVLNFVNQIFREALKERATDIHMEPLERDLRIRYRVDGKLLEVPVPPNMRLLQASLISRLKIMAHLDIAERRMPQDGRINLELDGEPIDVRVATIPSVNGESVALRLLTRKKFDLMALGLDPATEATIRKRLAAPNGIILVTGPTGSGKSTSLNAFLRKINSTDLRIITIEDPIEYEVPGVNQMQVRPEIGLTFADALRHVLRQDPDVIMVGEIRDKDTAEIAIRASLTGHLVFSTLHTNDAPGAITRLVDMGIEPFLVASAIELVIAQRLVRRLCPECSKPAPIARVKLQETLAILGCHAEEAEGIELLKSPVGCDRCRGTGYRGRIGIFEIFRLNDEMHELVLKRESTRTLADCARKHGMRTLGQSGWEKVKAGYTSFDEVLRVITVTEK